MSEEARQHVADMQRTLAQAGMYSATWRDGEMWHLIASDNPRWVDEEMHRSAPADGVATWVPAQQREASGDA